MIVARPVGQYDGIVSPKGGKRKDGSRWTNERNKVHINSSKSHTLMSASNRIDAAWDTRLLHVHARKCTLRRSCAQIDTYKQSAGTHTLLHHTLLAPWHLPPTQQRSVGGWIISLPWGRENEREEGGWEGGCSQPGLMSFYGKYRALEQTKQHSTATCRHGRKHEYRALLKITE